MIVSVACLLPLLRMFSCVVFGLAHPAKAVLAMSRFLAWRDESMLTYLDLWRFRLLRVSVLLFCSLFFRRLLLCEQLLRMGWMVAWRKGWLLYLFAAFWVKEVMGGFGCGIKNVLGRPLNIPNELYDAANIDGANRLWIWWYVTLFDVVACVSGGDAILLNLLFLHRFMACRLFFFFVPSLWFPLLRVLIFLLFGFRDRGVAAPIHVITTAMQKKSFLGREVSLDEE